MTEYNVASTERGEGVEQYRKHFKGIREDTPQILYAFYCSLYDENFILHQALVNPTIKRLKVPLGGFS
jgi:hypothetical protein